MNLNRFFNHQTRTVTLAAGVLAISIILSGFLSTIGDFLLARRFGAGPLDIYFAAFRIPDLIYNILIAGGIVVAFLPLFSEYFSKDKKIGWQFTSNCLNVFLFLLIFLCLILFIITPALIKLIVPGFSPEKLNQTIFLTRILFFSPILLGLSSIFSGILQYFNRFLVYSLAPVLYNLGIIFGILFFSPHFGILGVVFGVILGALFHLSIQIPSALNCGFKYQPILNFKDSSIKRFFLLIIPRTFGIAAQQINLLVTTAIASALSLGSIAIFTFSNNFQNFIIGIFGTSFAIAAFPNLAKSWVELKKEEFIKNFSKIFRQILYFVIPLSLLIFLLKNQIINLWLRHGQFSLIDAKLTAASLGLFSFSLFASSLIPLIFRAFFSFQETKTPTLIAIISIVLNVFLSFYLTRLLSLQNFFQNFIKEIFSLQGVKDISVLGLPLAFSVATIFQFIILIFFLYKRIGNFELKEIFNSFLKILISSILTSGGVYFTLKITFLFPKTFWLTFWQIAISGLIGALLYIIFTLFLGSPEIETFLKIRENLLKSKKRQNQKNNHT